MGAFRVGLTGGIASGKSVVADRFLGLGIAVADADLAARAVVAPGAPVLEEIVAVFGPAILRTDGSLDRPRLRERVFADPAARQQLEALLHPPIRAALRAQADAATGPYVVVAIPLLAEGGGRAAYPWLDRILVIDAPPASQRARLLARDAITAELADRMLAAQATRLQRLEIADDVVVNDGALADLDAHVADLDRQYRGLAARA